jgi:hypothetical protein
MDNKSSGWMSVVTRKAWFKGNRYIVVIIIDEMQ